MHSIYLKITLILGNACIMHIHMELLFTYAHFKTGLSGTHPMVYCFFFTDELSHLLYDIAGRWEGSCVKNNVTLNKYCMIHI
jgi:hypothetical protein